MDSTSQPQAPSLHQIRPSSLYEPQRSDTMPMPTLPSLNSSMGQTKRKRSPEKTPSQKPSKMIKKSHSTPMMAPGSVSPTDSDKKRNKLGYHRTSVACGKFIPVGVVSCRPQLTPSIKVTAVGARSGV